MYVFVSVVSVVCCVAVYCCSLLTCVVVVCCLLFGVLMFGRWYVFVVGDRCRYALFVFVVGALMLRIVRVCCLLRGA